MSKSKDDKITFSTSLDKGKVKAINIAIAKGLVMPDGKKLSRSKFIETLLDVLIPKSETGVKELWEWVNREKELE